MEMPDAQAGPAAAPWTWPRRATLALGLAMIAFHVWVVLARALDAAFVAGTLITVGS